MNYIKNLLEERNITQRELARRTGLSRSSINKYVKGRNQMTIHSAFNLSIALGVDIGDFVKGVMNEL